VFYCVIRVNLHLLHKSGPWQSIRTTIDYIFKHGKCMLAHMHLLCVMLAISKLCIELLLLQTSVCVWAVSLNLPLQFPRIWNIIYGIQFILLNIYVQTYALWSFPIRVLHYFLFMEEFIEAKCTLYICWWYLYYTFYILFVSFPLLFLYFPIYSSRVLSVTKAISTLMMEAEEISGSFCF
jgi:hypothetical protein